MPRKPEPDTPSVQAYRSIVGDRFFSGTMEEFIERDAYDEELLGDEELKRPQVPIRNVTSSDFMARLPEQQKKMGIPPPNSMGGSCYGKVTSPMAFIRGVKHGSISPLSELDPVRLQEMKIRKRHQGKYLLCRITTRACRLVCTSFGVEDENGWLHLVTLHNFPYTDTMQRHELETVFPINTILAIREPYVKMSLNGQDCHTRIDTPSDLVFLEADDPLVTGSSWKTGPRPFPSTVRTSEQWKTAGNKHFRDGEYFTAIIAYTFGLRQDPALVTLRLNRALSYLRLEQYHSALSECEEVLDMAGVDRASKVKALYRAGQATYSLVDYPSAQDWYERYLSEDPTFDETQSAIKKCIQRIKEQETGEYDWVGMFQNGQRRPSRQDVANYQGPIQVVPIQGRGGGRGVVAARDIKMGELLVVSKATIIAYRADHREDDLIATHDFCTKKWVIGMYHSAIQRLVAKTSASPALTSELFDLYAGPDYPMPAPSNASGTTQSHHDRPLTFPLDVNINRLENILILNNLLTVGQDDRFGLDPQAPVALFKVPAYFNHSCYPNTSRICYGDVIVIRAIEDIPKGQEITVAYYFSARYQRRQEILAKHMAHCQCELCAQDRADTSVLVTRRDQLVEEAEKTDMKFSQTHEFVEAVESTFPADPDPGPRIRPALAYAYYRWLLSLSRTTGDEEDLKLIRQCTIQSAIGFLDWSGPVTLDRFADEDIPSRVVLKSSDKPFFIFDQRILDPVACAGICIAAAFAFCELKMPRKSRTWLQGALWLENMALGGGIKLFKARHEAKLKGSFDIWSIINEIELSIESGDALNPETEE